MNVQEACERIEMLMAQPYHHNLQRVKAILEDLEKTAYERGRGDAIQQSHGGLSSWTPNFKPIFTQIEDEGA